MSDFQPVITIYNTETKVSGSTKILDTLSKHFEQDNYIRLSNLISEDLLNQLYGQIMDSEWEERVHDEIGIELSLRDHGINGVMNFLLNDPALFRLLERITGCGIIGSFTGRVYRMVPGAGHYDSWHGDAGEHRLLALSMNLGKEVYHGGVLELRERFSNQTPASAPNTGFGDAILFRIAPHLEHRVSNLEGHIPKTAFAGWFRSEPDYWSMLKGTGTPQSKSPSNE